MWYFNADKTADTQIIPCFYKKQSINRSTFISCSITRRLSAQLHCVVFFYVKSDRKMEDRNHRQRFIKKKRGPTTDCHSESVRSQKEGGGAREGESSLLETLQQSPQAAVCQRCALYHECNNNNIMFIYLFPKGDLSCWSQCESTMRCTSSNGH